MQTYRKQVLIGFGALVLALIAVVAVFNARDMIRQLDTFPLWLLGPMLILKWVSWVSRYAEWHYLLGVIGVDVSRQHPTQPVDEDNPTARLSLKDSVLIWTAGLPVAVSPGKVAEVLKSFLLKNMTHVPVARSVPVVLAERLVDGIAVTLLAPVSALMISKTILNADDVSMTYVQWILVLAVIAQLMLIGIIQFRRIATRILRLLRYVPLIRRYHLGLQDFYESSYDIVKFRHLAPTVGLGTIGYFCDGIVLYLTLIGLGEPHSLSLVALSIFILGFSVIIAAISAMPGGAGGRELTVGVLLTTMVGMNDAAIGVAVVMTSFFQVWFGTILGLIVIFIFRKRLFTPALQADIEKHQQVEAVHEPLIARSS